MLCVWLMTCACAVRACSVQGQTGPRREMVPMFEIDKLMHQCNRNSYTLACVGSFYSACVCNVCCVVLMLLHVWCVRFVHR
jgi:hypothetical protein